MLNKIIAAEVLMRAMSSGADFAELFADAEIFPVSEHQKVGAVQSQFSVFIEIVFVNRDLYHIRNEEIVGAEGNDIGYSALKGERAVFDGGSGNFRGRDERQTGFLDFIHNASGYGTAVVADFHQGCGSQVYHKLAAFLDDIVGMPFGADGD